MNEMNELQFKVGDRVRCIDASGGTSLLYNQEYQVTGITYFGCYNVDYQGYDYHSSRFELVEKSATKPNEQIIHCKHDNDPDCYGSTWLFTESDRGQKYVDVQYVICHPRDQYTKKIGVMLAKSKPKVSMLKGEVLQYRFDQVYQRRVNYPSTGEIYQAIVHLIK